MPDLIWVYPLGVVVLLPFFFMAAISHDRLVRRLYDLHRDEWRQAGGPRGFFWKPPEALPQTSLAAFLKSSLTWAFRLPDALRNDPSAQRIVRMFRLGLVVWNVGMIVLFATVVANHGLP